MTTPLLVFGWGNPSRGDDALGPLFVERLKALAGGEIAGQVEFLEEYQLQIEHALDLVGRTAVLFVDASFDCIVPFQTTTLRAARDASFTTHALSPESLMHVYVTLNECEPPPCTLLTIRGRKFELGAPPEPLALSNMAHALVWGLRWLASPGAPPPIAQVPQASHA
jgi:hydrogenase maturation protease